MHNEERCRNFAAAFLAARSFFLLHLMVNHMTGGKLGKNIIC
jgi:hypothetical protein